MELFNYIISDPICTKCSAGSFSYEGSNCTLCPYGYFSNTTGTANCTACPPGYYSDIM